jgi:hypothetical protein
VSVATVSVIDDTTPRRDAASIVGHFAGPARCRRLPDDLTVMVTRRT